MKVTTKRRLSVVLIGLGALGVGASAAFGSLAGDPERIAATEIHVAVAKDGTARIDEMIDYDFGSASGKHGIFRDVPGLTESSDVRVSSDAPDQSRCATMGPVNMSGKLSGPSTPARK